MGSSWKFWTTLCSVAIVGRIDENRSYKGPVSLEDIFQARFGVNIFKKCWSNSQVKSFLELRDFLVLDEGNVSPILSAMPEIRTDNGPLEIGPQDVCYLVNFFYEAVEQLIEHVNKKIAARTHYPTQTPPEAFQINKGVSDASDIFVSRLFDL